MRRSSAATASLSVAVTVLPEMETSAFVPAISRLEPVFRACTVNALLWGLDVVFSAVSKVTVSVAPFTLALAIRDGSTVTVTVSLVVTVPSLTVSENVRAVELLTGGAMNTGVADVASSSATFGPAVWVQA